jgi:hypothetical protein
MVNFKKVLGLAAPALVFAGMAFGQTPVACTLMAPGAPYIRAEGTTELLPQITVNCAMPLTGPTLNVQVFVTPVTTITSKVLSTSPAQTEAVAIGTGTPVLGSVSGNAVTFSGVAASGTMGVLTISNIRIDASQIPVATGIPNAVNVSVFITNGNTVEGTVAATPIAYVVPGLAASKISGVSAIPVCQGSNSSSPAAFTVTASDFFPGAFKTGAATPGPTSESSTVPLASPASNAVNSGTRIKLVFAGVPTGATIYVPTSVKASDGSIITLTASEMGALSPVSPGTGSNVPTGTAAVTVSNGGGQAVYEVTTANATMIDSFMIPVNVVAASNGTTPSATPLTVAVSFAPIGAASSNIPNFVVGSSTSPLTASNFTICATNLLFPYITNQSGFDTGLAIANTSTDPFGTKLGAAPQAGNCTLNFYGALAPAAVTTPSIPSGTVFTQIVSSIAPGFQGYMIAQCNFLFGHGYAFLTNGLGSGGGLAEGYLAGVIPDVNLTSGRKASPGLTAGAGESLGN